MKIIRNLILFITIILAFSCSKETEVSTEKGNNNEQDEENTDSEEPETVVYFTYDSSNINQTERWIIIHDQNGNLLDFKQDNFNGPIQFVMNIDSVPEKINITKLSYSKSSDESSEYHRLITYTDISKNSVWEDNPNSFTGNLVGAFDFRIENIDGYEAFQISTPFNILRPGDFSTEVINDKITLKLTGIPLYDNMDYLITVRDGNGLSKYVKLIPENGVSYTEDFIDLLEFDEYVDYNLPESTFHILQTGGIYSNEQNTYWGEGQVFTELLGSDERVFKSGFLDGYDRYLFGLSISFEDFGYSFNNIGDKVSDIDFPVKPEFIIVSKDIYNLEFSTELNPVTKTTRHNSEIYDEQGKYLNTSWEVFSTGIKNQKIYSLPVQLIERFPNIELDELNLNTIILYTQGYEQQQFFIDATSKNRIGNYTSEYYRFSF